MFFQCPHCGMHVDSADEILLCDQCGVECCILCAISFVDGIDLCEECASQRMGEKSW